jgi:hypothetical protein
VCGLDVHETRNDEESAVLCIAHIKALREHPCFREARIVLIPEANLANEAQIVSRHVFDHCGRGVYVAVQHAGVYGVNTNGVTRPLYVRDFKGKLDESAIRYHDRMVCANPAREARGESYSVRLAAAKREYEQQVATFRVGDHVPESMRQQRSRWYGAADNNGRRSERLRDDMAMAGMMALHWSGQLRIGQIIMVDKRGQYEPVVPRSRAPYPSLARRL